jgi:hypothetical protein
VRPDAMGSNWVALDWIGLNGVASDSVIRCHGMGFVKLDSNEKEVGQHLQMVVGDHSDGVMLHRHALR